LAQVIARRPFDIGLLLHRFCVFKPSVSRTTYLQSSSIWGYPLEKA
jgi:hypothetical protein